MAQQAAARLRRATPAGRHAPVSIRTDPAATAFLRGNHARAATVDASTIAVDPAHSDSSTTLAHEFAHVGQLRSGRTTSRAAAEEAADRYARGETDDPGAAAAPPLFQPVSVAAIDTDPLADTEQARAKAEQRDIPKLGFPVGGARNTIEVGGAASIMDFDAIHPFRVAVTATGQDGSVESTTDYTIHRDPRQQYTDVFTGPAVGKTGTIVDIEGKHPAGLAPVEAVPVYPIILKYHRDLKLTDRKGRTCIVTISSTMQFTYERWEAETSGQTPSLEVLQSLVGDSGFTGVVISGEGPVQKYGAMATSDVATIDSGVAQAEQELEGADGLKDAAGLPMTFIRPEQTAGAQFETLEAVLERLDAKELERRAKLPVMETSGGSTDDDSPAARGVLTAFEKFTLGFALILGMAGLIASLPLDIGFAAALGYLALSAAVVAFFYSLVKRSREASDAGITNPAGVFSSAILDTIGVGPLVESVTDTSILTGRDLKRSQEQRWESGTEGLLGLIMTVLGARSIGGRSRAPVDSPDPVPDLQRDTAPDTTPDTQQARPPPRASPVERALSRVEQDITTERGSVNARKSQMPAEQWARSRAGATKRLYNLLERRAVLTRMRLFPSRTYLEQAEIIGVETGGTLRPTAQISSTGKGRIADILELDGGTANFQDLKSPSTQLKSVSGGLSSPDVEVEFRPSSEIAKQHAVEEDVIDAARRSGGRVIVVGIDPVTGAPVRLSLDPNAITSSVTDYNDVGKN